MMTAIGLMSGTSLDGIDLALLRTDGLGEVRLGPSLARDYGEADRALLRQALEDARAITTRGERPGVLAAAERRITELHAALVTDFLQREDLGRQEIDVVGFHGQTVLHRPETGVTVQIGDGAALAAATGLPVVYDLRAADVAAGGQGAPLVPVFHRALVEAGRFEPPVAVVNLGGVGNITFVDPGAEPVAFDTGPGNALLDDLVRARLGLAFDRDGALALAGTVDEAALQAMLGHPFFAEPPPKSLDRNAFRPAVDHLAPADAAATLAAFTAASVAAARRFLPREPRLWVVCGGGARNRAIMSDLQRRVPGRVATGDEVGWSSAMMEAQAFAYLAVRSLKGLPLTFPSTTGVPAPMTGGVLARPSHAEAGA